MDAILPASLSRPRAYPVLHKSTHTYQPREGRGQVLQKRNARIGMGHHWPRLETPQCDVLLSWYDTMSIKYTPANVERLRAPSHPK